MAGELGLRNLSLVDNTREGGRFCCPKPECDSCSVRNVLEGQLDRVWPSQTQRTKTRLAAAAECHTGEESKKKTASDGFIPARASTGLPGNVGLYQMKEKSSFGKLPIKDVPEAAATSLKPWLVLRCLSKCFHLAMCYQSCHFKEHSNSLIFFLFFSIFFFIHFTNHSSPSLPSPNSTPHLPSAPQRG